MTPFFVPRVTGEEVDGYRSLSRIAPLHGFSDWVGLVLKESFHV